MNSVSSAVFNSELKLKNGDKNRGDNVKKFTKKALYSQRVMEIHLKKKPFGAKRALFTKFGWEGGCMCVYKCLLL